uniref:Uncharacterized protein n=1 Tax=viral metagenome TaxID=1070528 RepID=A0A6C0IC42_9ZZZZ
MADPSVKTISITGNAAQLGGDGARRRNTRKSRKEETKITYFPTRVTNLIAGGSLAPPVPPVPVQQTNIPPPAPIYPPKMGGASTSHLNTKLILSPPKKKETRLLLKGPKQAAAAATAVPDKTRKAVRKIKLGLRGLTTKIHRATRLHKKVKEMKKEDIEQLLKEKGLLKAGKKAPPEALMRQMYADYLMLTSRGL